jgi:hypothetical protein
MTNVDNNRNWNIWLIKLAVSVLLFLGVVAIFQIVVDPFAIWRLDSKTGFNHRKAGQSNRDHMFKVYQYAMVKPQIVFVGNSRASYGLLPKWAGVPEEKIYNLAFNAQRMGETEQLVDFLLNTHRPEVIVLNLNPVMLTNKPQPAKRDSNFETRLRAISTSALTGTMFKLKESVFSMDAVEASLKTLKSSYVEYSRPSFYNQGWFQRYGARTSTDRNRYRKNYWRFFSVTHRSLGLRKDTFKAFVSIVQKLKKEKVPLVVFFGPLSADFQLSINSYGRLKKLEYMKRSVATVTPFWDFADINSVTTNRNNYVDASHYRGVVGEQIINRLNGKDAEVADDFGVYVTEHNVIDHLKDCRKRLKQWRIEHPGLHRLLRKMRTSKNEKRFIKEIRKLVW